MLASFAAIAYQTRSPLQSTIDALNNLTHASYSYVRTLDYPGEKFHQVFKATLTFQKTKGKDPLKYTFSAGVTGGRVSYDGKTLSIFTTPNGNNQIKSTIISNPQAIEFQSLPFMKIPLMNLAESLVAAQKSPKFHLETLSNSPNPGANQTAYRLLIPGFELSPTPPLFPVDYNPIYELTIDNETHFPIKCVQHFKNNNDTMTVEYSNIKPL